MKCSYCELESEIVSQMFVKREGDKINTRTPMSYKCPNGHIEYRKYDSLT